MAKLQILIILFSLITDCAIGNEFFKVEIESLLMVMDYINYKYEEKDLSLQKKFDAKSLNQCEAIIRTIKGSIKNEYKAVHI